MSDLLTESAGCPRGYVLSPVLFSLFINHKFVINDQSWILIKYANEMGLVGLVKKHDPTGEAVYLFYKKALVTWCCQSRLDMTVAKTKELNKTLKWSSPYSMAHLLKPLRSLNTQHKFFLFYQNRKKYFK